MTVPPSIQALLAARLDALASDERSVIEPASVSGYHFPAAARERARRRPRSETVGGAARLARGASTWSPARGRRRGRASVRPHHDPRHRVRRLLKRARADLHERFAAWADVANRDRGAEFEEILGYHLEQACNYLAELGPLDDRGREIGDAGGAPARVGRPTRIHPRRHAGRRVNLLGRAAALLPAERRGRLRLLPEYGEALLMNGRFEEASEVLQEAIDNSMIFPAPAARASLVQLLVRLRTGGGPDGWNRERVEEEIAGTMLVFEKADDSAGLAMAYRLRAWSAGTACRFGEAAEASEHAVEHARRARTCARSAARQPPTPPQRHSGRRSSTRRSRAASPASSRRSATASRRGTCSRCSAASTRRRGRSTGRASSSHVARGLLEEIGLDVDAARAGIEAWRVEMLAGEYETAERELRAALEALESLGERYFLSTVYGLMAQTLLEHGASLDDVDELCRRSEELATPDDVATQALWRCAAGRSLARRGSLADGEARVREALDLLATTDATVLLLDAYLDLGEVLELAGRYDEAREAYETARGHAELKGGVVPLQNVLRRLDTLVAVESDALEETPVPD